MVIEIKSIGCIEDLKKVPGKLGFSKDDNWLNVACYSLSTKSGTLAFAHRRKIIVLSNQWDTKLQQFKYSIVWNGELECSSDEEITAIACLTVTSEQNESTTENTCLLVGLSSGYLHILNTRGAMLVSQQWHSESILGILLQNETRKTIEEIYVIYKSCVCILQSKQLVKSMRNIKLIDNPCRCNDLLGTLSARLWKYGDNYGKSDTVTNGAIIGSKQIGLFDHLLAASMEGGFHAKYRSSAPQQLAVLSIGMNPFIGFYYAKEIFIQPVLSDMARIVTNKVKNVLPSWLTGSQPAPSPLIPMPTVSTESMSLRYALSDDHRATLRVWLSARNRLAAISDNLGRIILVDCLQTVILRIWKGYRDAQCAFIQVDEKLSKNTHKQKRKHTTFLAIYSPRRSTVDVWCVERGKKLAVFPAGPHGQLIQQFGYSSPGIDGSSSTKSTHSVPTTAFYLNPSDLSIKELTVPFHHALDTSSTKKSKDLHIINQIKVALKSFEENQADVGEEISDLCDSIQTNEMRYKCVNTLLKSRHLTPEILGIVLDSFLKSTSTETGNETNETGKLTVSNTQLIDFLTNQQKLVNFFVSMKPKCPAKRKPTVDNEDDSDSSEEREFEDIFKVIDSYKMCLMAKRSSRVTIQSPHHRNNAFIEYMSIFDCIGNDGIQLNESKITRFSAVAFDLFDIYIQQSDNLDGFLKKAMQSSINSKDLSRLFLRYWMEKEIQFDKRDRIERHLKNFLSIFSQICELDYVNVQYMYNSLSPWWQEIREILLESPSVLKSLLAAMMCRDISIQYRQTENNDNSGEDEPWEEVSQEAAQWSLLIGKLDDVAVLSSILTQKPSPIEGSERPSLPYSLPEISLVTILNGGKGIISDLVAKWLASTGISPAVFFKSIEDVTAEADTLSPPELYIRSLRKHFPFSLTSGVLLAHLTYEFMTAWHENVKELELLAVALECLESFEEADFAIHHGISCKIWNQFVRQAYVRSMKVVNRIEDAKSNTAHGFTDIEIPEFITHCDGFLKQLQRSRSHREATIKFEELLQEGKMPLVISATQQDTANCDLITLHLQMNQIMMLMTSLNVNFKHSTQTLFNEASQQLFGTEINTRQTIEIPRTDEMVKKQRQKFLHRTIKAAVDLVRFDFEETYVVDYEIWVDKVMALAKQWAINTEDLLKFQVMELYIRGWDDFAETKLEQLAQPSSMGKKLLRITGARMNQYIKDKPEIYSRVVSIGSLISLYLETLDESDVKLPPNDKDSYSFVDRLLKLARKTYECMNEQEGQELRLAAQMFDACAEIKSYLNNIDDI